jgi:outer membrane biosynthesis protein TonB
MNAIGLTATQGPDRNGQHHHDMKSPLVASLLFHGFLILLFSGAFFFFSKPVEFPEEAMAVEILPVSEKAQSNFEAPVAPKKKEEPKEVKDEPPPMPKATEQSKTPKPPEPKKTERKKLEDKPKETPKPVKKAEVAKEKPVPPVPVKKEEAKETPKEDTEEFSSVLKNLVGDEQAEPTPDSVPRDTPRQAPQLTAPAPLGSQLTMSEMDGLRSQLAQCWHIIAGARDAQDLVVDVDITVSAAKTVIDARIVDQLRYSSDTLFRAAADSAIRALHSPACTPLNLPDGKYEQWKTITLQFDPKNMF